MQINLRFVIIVYNDCHFNNHSYSFSKYYLTFPLLKSLQLAPTLTAKVCKKVLRFRYLDSRKQRHSLHPLSIFFNKKITIYPIFELFRKENLRKFLKTDIAIHTFLVTFSASHSGILQGGLQKSRWIRKLCTILLYYKKEHFNF